MKLPETSLLSQNAALFATELDRLGKQQRPFLFDIDYLGENFKVWPLEDAHPSEVLFDFGIKHNLRPKEAQKQSFRFEKHPVSFEEYESGFNHVMKEIRRGNSFLTNYSKPTRLSSDLTLKEIFLRSSAPYRLWVKDEFVCFSPESFVRVEGRHISAYPMKGTIDASIPRAGEIILSDPKETAEHATIVDLIRSDLSRVADKVWVEKYRYLTRILTTDKTLLQMSSMVVGELPENFDGAYGTLLCALLPAGSISGAPKPSTLKIIREAEHYDRGYYTGIMGVSDGNRLETAVMIRFIEQKNTSLIYKSGGGITSSSDVRKEYQEMIDKVYLPFEKL